MAPSNLLKGTYFPPKQSQAHDATLSFSQLNAPLGKLHFVETELTVQVVAISDRLAGVERTITLDNGGTFSTRDDATVERLVVQKRGWFGGVSRLEKFGPHLIVLIALIVGLVYGIARYGLPIAAKVAVWATPPELVKVIDSSAMSTLNQLFLDTSELPQARQEELRKSFSKLVTHEEHQEKKTRLLFKKGGTIGPNAFALPGGTVVVTDELAGILSNDEIVAVLAHELAHVRRSHGLQQMYRAFGFAGLVAVFGGDIGAIGEEVIGGGGLLVAMAASREMETEADADAVEALHQLNRDPAALKSALNKLYAVMCKGNHEECDGEGWFSSHPGGKRRDDDLDAAIKRLR